VVKVVGVIVSFAAFPSLFDELDLAEVSRWILFGKFVKVVAVVARNALNELFPASEVCLLTWFVDHLIHHSCYGCFDELADPLRPFI